MKAVALMMSTENDPLLFLDLEDGSPEDEEPLEDWW